MKIWSKVFGNKIGIPLLLISGANTNHKQWSTAYIDNFVEKGFYVICYDNRDFGKSTWKSNSFTLNDMANDALSVLKQYNVNSANIVGCSMGGMVAQVLAAEYPEHVKTMTNIMSTPAVGIHDSVLSPPTTKWIRSYEQSLDYNKKKQYEKAIVLLRQAQEGSKFKSSLDTHKKYAKSIIEQGYNPNSRHGMAIVSSPGRKETVKKISAPSFIIHGDEDPLLPLDHGLFLVNNIPKSKMKILKGVGHELPDELANEIVGDIANFLTINEISL